MGYLGDQSKIHHLIDVELGAAPADVTDSRYVAAGEVSFKLVVAYDYLGWEG